MVAQGVIACVQQAVAVMQAEHSGTSLSLTFRGLGLRGGHR